MDKQDHAWWARMASAYPQFFSSAAHVVEMGSMYVNGSIRDHFTSAGRYVGVDWRGGRNVDHVSLAHEVDFLDASFDAVVSASMLEHDPYWDQSLSRMCALLRPTGALFMSWGAAANVVHDLEASPIGEFHRRKASDVLAKIEDLGMGLQSFEYEGGDYGRGHGHVALCAWKDPGSVVDAQIEVLSLGDV